jgi:hypothetical protein
MKCIQNKLKRMEENIFKQLEKYKLKKFGEAPDKISENIEKNKNLFATIGETMDLFTEKLVKTIIKINS